MSDGITIINAEIEGIEDMLMHNGQLADPTNKWAKAMKEITGQRGKTEDQYIELARLEFLGGLYYDEVDGVFLPGEALEACLIDGAKKRKLGKNFKSAVFVHGHAPLNYGAKLSPEDMWKAGTFKDTRGVVVGQSRVQRTRPVFRRGWKVAFQITLIEEAGINVSDVKTALMNAGTFSGLGDFRPRYGRFKVASFEQAAA